MVHGSQLSDSEKRVLYNLHIQSLLSLALNLFMAVSMLSLHSHLTDDKYLLWLLAKLGQ